MTKDPSHFLTRVVDFLKDQQSLSLDGLDLGPELKFEKKISYVPENLHQKNNTSVQLSKHMPDPNIHELTIFLESTDKKMDSMMTQPNKKKMESMINHDPLQLKTLTTIRENMGDCRLCKLCQGRKNIVFGSGNPNARLVFVGEGPGADEDIQGLPFVGRAGQLLTKMITAMGLDREQVYICNVVKCRPPHNREPEPEEVMACEPFLQSQLAVINPDIIVTLGKHATHALLKEKTPISKLRGVLKKYHNIPLMPTYHPAYLLRNPAEKKVVWQDLQSVMKFLKLPIPSSSVSMS